MIFDAVYSSQKGRNETLLRILGRNNEKLSLDIMREYNTLMISSARSDFKSLKDVKLCLMLVIYLQKAGMKQY